MRRLEGHPERLQACFADTKKGKQWHFGMKAHIGVDSESGLTHTPAATRRFSRRKTDFGS